MKRCMLLAVFISVLYGVAVDAVCDSTTPSKVKKCIVESELFQYSQLPKNFTTAATFCSANNGLQTLTECMVAVVNDCVGDDKQDMLVRQLIAKEKYMNGLGQMCNYTSAFATQKDCPPKLTMDPFSSCVEAAQVDLTNAGQPSNLNVSLNIMCTYFAAYKKCFQDLPSTECSDVAMFYTNGISGVEYPYCSLSQEKRREAIDNYENYVSSSAGLVFSVLTVTASLVVSKIV